jgi:penicillin-binding protein 2
VVARKSTRKSRFALLHTKKKRRRQHPVEEETLKSPTSGRHHFGRVNFVYGFVFIAMGSLILRLGYVQINKGDYFRSQASTVSVEKIDVLPSRGWIYDANGQLLAYNKPAFSVTLQVFHDTKQDFHNMAKLLAPVFHANARQLEVKMAQRGVPSKDRLSQINLFKNISRQQVAFIEEHQSQLPGITIQTDGQRVYPEGDLAGQVLGYIGAIPKGKAGQKYLHPSDGQPKYILTQKVGVAGIEAEYERLLQGKVGKQEVLVDTSGDAQKQLGFAPAPQPGKSLQLTLDGHLQAEAQQTVVDEVKHSKYANQITFASAVVLDVQTGGVLAMVSYPYLDPNWYSPGNGGYLKHIHYLQTSGAQLNHAIQGPQIPGSTVKPANLITALEAGVISPWTTMQDVPKILVAGWPIKDDAYHGLVSPIKAIAESCDYFFYQVGLRLTNWLGASASNGGVPGDGKSVMTWATTDFWKGYLKLMMGEWRFGLGPLTGIDLPGEEPGKAWVDVLSGIGGTQIVHPPAANNDLKKDGKINVPVSPVDGALAGIGQIQQFTTIQLAQYVATLANGGKRVQPHLLKAVYPSIMKPQLPKDAQPIEVVKPKVQAKLKLEPQFLQIAREGMKGALNSPGGTAYAVFHNAPYTAAGKTGTGEITLRGKKMDNSVFIAYAPYDKPQIAVAVMVPGAGFGADTAAPVARKIMDDYFKEHHEFFKKKDWQDATIPSDWKRWSAYQQPEQTP